MDDARELKIVFTGPMGAGKTTAIEAISHIPPVRTDVANNDTEVSDKALTTVALDYGQLQLDSGMVVRLYGTPGQERFGFMRKILCAGAIGVILLLDGSRQDVVPQLESFMADIRSLSPMPSVVIGVGRCAFASTPGFVEVLDHLEKMGFVMPAFRVDVRRKDDVLLLVDTLVCLLEAGLHGEAMA